MTEADVWRDPNDDPLKFQDGDPVKINWSEPLHPLVQDPIRQGWVRGYDLVTGQAPAYYVHYFGREMLIVERGLEKLASPPLPHTCHGGVCGICGHGVKPRGLSIFAGPDEN